MNARVGWGVAAVAAVGVYTAVGWLAPVSSTTVVVDRTYEVASPEGIYCGNLSVNGTVVFSQAPVPVRVPLLTRPGRAEVGVDSMGFAISAANEVCAGQRETSRSDGDAVPDTFGLVEVVLGDPACEPFVGGFGDGSDEWFATATCGSEAARVQTYGRAGASATQVLQIGPMPAPRGCIDMAVMATLYEDYGAMVNVTGGEPVTDRVCASDAS